MSTVEALSGANGTEMAQLTAQAKELGAITKFTAQESGEAMSYMGMAGWNAQEMLSGMPGVLNLAALFTGPVGPILAVGAAVGTVTAGVMGLIEAANEGAPNVADLAASIDLQTNSIDGGTAALHRQTENSLHLTEAQNRLRVAEQKRADIQGLDAVISSFADGSSESVNAVAGLASATDEELLTIVGNWQNLQSEHEEAAESISQLKTHFTAEMDALQSELEADIQAMNLGPESYQQGMATIRSYIQGAASMEGEVRAVYSRLASVAQSALSVPSSGGLLRRTGGEQISGYATGTENADPGFAMVGENGPELVFFGGGEQVLNARETAALQASPPVSALPDGTGAQPMVVQIYFQIEGNATPETVAQLQQYGDEFEMRVRRVMDEYARDTARRRYGW